MTPRERCAEIESSEGNLLRALVREAAKLASAKVPFQQKAERFVDMAETISRAITPHTPCATGCSHCCHMATAISGYEAGLIGRYIGREPIALNRQYQVEQDMQRRLIEAYTGVPCPFLAAGRCTVYAVRPIACRVHHSVNETSDACRIIPREFARAPGVVTPVPRVNLTAFINVQALAFLSDDFGDIREFFP